MLVKINIGPSLVTLVYLRSVQPLIEVDEQLKAGQTLALGHIGGVVEFVKVVNGEVAGLPAELFALLARDPLCA